MRKLVFIAIQQLSVSGKQQADVVSYVDSRASLMRDSPPSLIILQAIASAARTGVTRRFHKISFCSQSKILPNEVQVSEFKYFDL